MIPFDDGDAPMVAAMKLEGELHRRFADTQRAEHGWAGSEWFAASAELLQFIRDSTTEPATRQLERTIYKKKSPGTSS